MSEVKYGDIVVYQSDDGLTRVDVRFEGDTVWLTQAQLIDLYHSSKSNISEHIKHIFEDGELNTIIEFFAHMSDKKVISLIPGTLLTG